MTNKVMEIRGLIKEHASSLAESIRERYEQLRIQKCNKEAEWKEVQKYIFATDTKSTSNSDLPWRNTTTIPKIAQIRDNLHANYMDALFPNDNWLVWEGDSLEDVEIKKRRTIETYVKNKAINSGIREVMSDLIYDYIDFGNAFAEVIWVNDTHFDPVLQEEVTTYAGPRVRRISPYDHVFDATASTYANAPKFTRYLKSIGELKKEIKTRPDLQFDEKVLQQAIDLRHSISAYDMEDTNKAEGYTADGFGTYSEYLGSHLVELIEFEGDWYDIFNDELMENRIITIIDGDKILRNIPNPNWLGVDNKVHVGWRDRQDNLYGMGPLDNLIGMQYRIDHLENLKADALDATIDPPKVIRGEVEPFVWGPGAEIRVPEDGDVTILPPNQAAFQVNNEIAFLMQTMEEMAGAPRQAMGVRTPGEKTAFEVQTLENNAGRIFHSKTNKFEILLLEKVMNLFLATAKMNLDMKDMVRVMDNDLGVVEFMSVTRQDITAKGKLRPMGARHFAARAQLMQNLQGIASGPLMPMLQAHLSRKALTSLVEETMGLNKHQLFRENIGITEEMETQRMMQQGQAQLENEQAVPLEENFGGI
jgi:hypothetical protein